MSWGNKLVFVFIGFAMLIGTLVYKAMTTKFELVTKDYYKEELRYQDKIDGAANASAAGNITLVQENGVVKIQLPQSLQAKTVEGEAWFYCKTKAANDKRVPLKMENGAMVFGESEFAKDNYELKLQFTADTKQYYYREYISVK